MTRWASTPPETRQTVRHNIVCYMRSIVSDDWPSMEDGLDQAITLLSEGTNPSTLRPCRDIPPK
jgi:hypothetical protein